MNSRSYGLMYVKLSGGWKRVIDDAVELNYLETAPNEILQALQNLIPRIDGLRPDFDLFCYLVEVGYTMMLCKGYFSVFWEMPRALNGDPVCVRPIPYKN